MIPVAHARPGLVSTIIPVFNRPRLLVEAVNSVLAQTYRPIEIIIVDDGSTDETAQVADTLAAAHSGIIQVVRRENGRAARAMNDGLRRATGEFIQILDSDDLLMAKKFELQVAALRLHPECGLSYCYTREYELGRTPPTRPARRTGRTFEQLFPDILTGRIFPSPSPLYRREVFDVAGLYPELERDHDWEFECRVGAARIRLHHCQVFLADVRNTRRVEGRGRRGSLQPLRDGAVAHERILEHARRAGVPADQLGGFAVRLFAMARQVAAAGLEADARRCLTLGQGIAQSPSQRRRMRAFEAVADRLGWQSTGRGTESAERVMAAIARPVRVACGRWRHRIVTGLAAVGGDSESRRRVRGFTKRALKTTGFDRVVSLARNMVRFGIHPQFRKLELDSWREYVAWRREYGAVLAPHLYPRTTTRRALIVTKGTIKGTQIELGLIKALELGGFVPVVLTDRFLEKHYRLAGVESFVRWEQFSDRDPLDTADAIVRQASGIGDLLGLEHAGARVGKFALSTSFRSLRVGRLDFTRDDTRRTLTAHLAAGMARADAAVRIVSAVKPDLALFMGNRYTGQGELMDVCVERGVDVLTWFDAHRSSSLMLKRYRMENRDRHHGSISDESWALLKGMPWTDAERERLSRELHDNYAAGDWYSRGGTQVNKSIVATDTLRSRLKLDPAKKTAVIFPHIVWDATLFWGADLFNNYEDWLVETVKAACGNPRVNWIIKIHPAHVAKSAMERYDGEPAELAAIRTRVGPLPPHVIVIPPDTDINTYSLFSVMDYCLTVRGTVGIEAACLGIRTLTAGSGRYDRRGFTTDSDTREQYLARVAAIEDLPPISGAERELAGRFACGAFLLRPLPLTSMSITHERDVEASMRVTVQARSSEELRRAPDMMALAAWAADGRQEDFLWELPGEVRLDRSA